MLMEMVKRLSKDAGIEGQFINHSQNNNLISSSPSPTVAHKGNTPICIPVQQYIFQYRYIFEFENMYSSRKRCVLERKYLYIRLTNYKFQYRN